MVYADVKIPESGQKSGSSIRYLNTDILRYF